MDTKFCLCVLLLFSVCYGQDHDKSTQKATQENSSKPGGIIETVTATLMTLLQNNSTDNIQHLPEGYTVNYDYNNNTSTSQGVTISVPVVTILLNICCIYYCCRCRTQRNQGEVLNTRLPPSPQTAPPPATQIIIQQHAAPAPMQHFPPTHQHVPQQYTPQQHVPPPYDTQPMWSPQPPQQQFHQQAPPTSYANPNYDQPPINPKH